MSTSNNKKKNDNVNTRGYQLYNSESTIFGSTLLVSYWNQYLTVRIHPMLDKERLSIERVYDYNEEVATFLDLPSIAVLMVEMKRTIFPAIEKRINKSIAIPTAANSLLSITVANASEYTTAYLTIYKDVDSKTRICKKFMHYEFKGGKVIEDYNPNTGDFNSIQTPYGEIVSFYNTLKSALLALPNVIEHSTRVINKWNNDKIVGLLVDIGKHLDVESKYLIEKEPRKQNNVWFEDPDSTLNKQLDFPKLDTKPTIVDSLDAVEEFLE